MSTASDVLSPKENENLNQKYDWANVTFIIHHRKGLKLTDSLYNGIIDVFLRKERMVDFVFKQSRFGEQRESYLHFFIHFCHVIGLILTLLLT